MAIENILDDLEKAPPIDFYKKIEYHHMVKDFDDVIVNIAEDTAIREAIESFAEIHEFADAPYLDEWIAQLKKIGKTDSRIIFYDKYNEEDTHLGPVKDIPEWAVFNAGENWYESGDYTYIPVYHYVVVEDRELSEDENIRVDFYNDLALARMLN